MEDIIDPGIVVSLFTKQVNSFSDDFFFTTHNITWTDQSVQIRKTYSIVNVFLWIFLVTSDFISTRILSSLRILLILMIPVAI
jgi:hypothetical protein